MEQTVDTSAGFAGTTLSPAILEILTRAGFITPTPIQRDAIPKALQGVDLIGVAQTGTGKTLAYGLPILDRLSQGPGKALILAPTRELALQVEEVLRKVSDAMRPNIGTAVLIGGASIQRQVMDLRRNPRIIIATPGRLQDHLDQGRIRLMDVRMLVLDEADRMLDMGFIAQIKRILKSLPAERQTMLFSATMSPEVIDLAADYMKSPVRVEVATSGATAPKIEQQLCYVSPEKKPELLHTLLNRYEGSVLVFSRTKHGAAKLTRSLSMTGHQAVEIHSNKSLGQRRMALDGFKSGRFRVLVATDVAARGIDVNDIALVVNYDLPDAAEDYVHRIGRTGRAGKVGLAISLAGHDQMRDVKMIERLISVSLPLSEYSEQPQPTTYDRPRPMNNRSRPQTFDRSRRPSRDITRWGR